MLRITENLENDKALRLRLDGTVSTESCAELAQLCSRHQLNGARTVILDMAGVNFMHDDAARRLARLRTESVRVINCSPFIAALLDAANRSEVS
jgi:anti-anti-sigma regulatory factor